MLSGKRESVEALYLKLKFLSALRNARKVHLKGTEFFKADRYSLSITEQLEDFGHIIMVPGRQKPLNLSQLCTTTL